MSGVTTGRSNTKEILDAYQKANEHVFQKIIVSDENRAAVSVVHFSGGPISEPLTFTSFSKFTLLQFHKENELVPSNQQITSYGLELESLPSKDKESFYESIINSYINGIF